MDTRVMNMNSWLEQSDHQILAIWGIGGSGKTTLARHFVYLNWEQFVSLSILEDIGNKTTEQLNQLQEKLLTDISKGKKRIIPSVWQGTCTIEKALNTRKALIVLDNIVKESHLFALLGDGTETQCKIIITTRESNPSKWFQSKSWRCQEFKMESLEKHDSLELLSLHAFDSKDPKPGYEDLLKKGLEYCEGNPLALGVLGSFLKEKEDKKLWESYLNSIEKELDKEIHGVLKWSNDLLSDLNKELFLHIACFFVGKDVDYVVKILEDDYNATYGIETLTKRCLLSVSPYKKLMMHRLVQEMARHIVYKEYPGRPSKRSRVWRNMESYDVLRKGMGHENMKGLALDMEMLSMDLLSQQNVLHTRKSSDLSTDSFKEMDNLQLLQLSFVKLTGTYENFSEKLKLICWIGFHLKAIPPDMHMENLVSIGMSYSFLEEFEPTSVLPSLKILNLKSSVDLKEIRNISQLCNLEMLILWNCRNLVRVCKSLKDLPHLSLLNITGCEKLCKRELQVSIGGESTQQLSFPLPCSLERLFLKDCNIVETDYFPLNFINQLHLKYLNIVNSPFELLPCYNHLKLLRVLDMSRCTKLESLLCLPRTLKELYIYYCVSLEKVTFESHRYTLQEFGYEGCEQMSEVEGLFKLVPVAKLNESDLGHMKWVREFEDLEVCLVGDEELTKGRSSCVQMLYEFNIMSISLPCIKIPKTMLEYTSEDTPTSLCFKVPESQQNRKLKGLNVTFKYTISDEYCIWFAKISTTNGVNLMYHPLVFGKPKADEVGTWLSYWPIGNVLKVGDEVNVSIVVMNGLEIQECGAGLVYTDEEAENETLLEKNELAEFLGGDKSEFKLSTGAYYLCRRDFFELMEVGILTPHWFRILTGDTIDSTEVGGWRKTGRPQRSYELFTELKYVRCITYGPESEDIYKIAERSKSSLVDKTVEFTSVFSKAATKDVDISENPDLDSTRPSKAFDADVITELNAAKDVDINEAMASTSNSLIEKLEYPRSMFSRLITQDEDDGYNLETTSQSITSDKTVGSTGAKRSEVVVERSSVKLDMDNELIKAAHIQSMKAHEHNQPYYTKNKKHGAGSSSSSMEVLIFAFKGPTEANDWYKNDLFGETDVDQNLFPSLLRIGETRLAKVNSAFLQRFQDVLISTSFKLEVEKAVMEDQKNILFTGHFSGGAIASFATLVA